MSKRTHIESVLKLDLPSSAKRAKLHIDFAYCILCQQKKLTPLVIPKNFEKVLDCVQKRANWNDLKYVTISSRLGALTAEELKDGNASWHSECYKECTHKANMDRSERIYKKQEVEELPSSSNQDEEDKSYTTRSHTPKHDRNKCIFCNKEGTKRSKLFTIATDSAGSRLKEAVDLSSNEILKIRLSDCTDPGDPHAKDIAYHKQCWNVHVVNVLRPKHNTGERIEQNSVSSQATNAELLSSLTEFLQEGNVTTMGKIEEHYRRIAYDHGLDEEQMKTRKKIKTLLEEELKSSLFILYSVNQNG